MNKMALKKLAQIKAEHELTQQEYEEAQRDSYPTRLMEVLSRATKNSLEIYVVDNEFRVLNRNGKDRFVWKMYYSHSTDYDESLSDLDRVLTTIEKEKEEYLRRANLKSSALLKLTKEEREALGV